MIHKDHNGKVSMMRVGFTVTLVIGSILCLGGVVAVFMGKDGNSLVTSGSLMMTGSGWAKAVQSKWERQNANTTKLD